MVTRRERVILELEDRFSRPTGQAAVESRRLEKTLRDLEKSGVGAGRALARTQSAAGGLDRDAKKAEQSINQLTGRLKLLLDVAAVLGPTIVPVGAAAIPVLAGMATQLAAVAGAGGIMLASLVGIGDGLEALNKAQLEPTEQNLAAARLEMEKLGPAGAAFVNYLDSITPQLKELQFLARDGFLPGLQDGIDALLDMGPQVSGLITEISSAMGDLARGSGEALAGPEFAAFFDYLDRRAAPLLTEFGQTVGNLVEGIANLMVGFEPITVQFSRGLLGITEDFAAWSRSLDSNQSFQAFVDYVRESGPLVVDLLGSLVQAIAGFVQAAAPIGQALLPVLTALVDAFAAIASSPVGTPLLAAAAALVAFNRAAQLGQTISASLSRNLDETGKSASRARQGFIALALGAGAISSINAIAEDTLPTVNELVGSLLELGETGAGLDGIDLQKSLGRIFDANLLEQFGDETLRQADWVAGLFGAPDRFIEGNRLGDAKDQITQLDQALSSLASSGGASAARDAFEQLATSQNLGAEQQEQLLSLLPGYRDALAGAANAADLHADAADDSAAAARREANAVEASRQAMLAKRQATLAAFDAETAYRQALVAATDSEKRNRAGLRGTSEAALDNRQRLSALAAAWNNQSEAVRTNNARQKEARSAFLRAAEGMGVGADKARRLADRMLAIPTKRDVNVRVLADNALRALELLRLQLRSIPDEEVNVFVRRRGAETSAGGLGPQPSGAADGGTVPRTGRRYADRHLYLLADGEEVVSNRHGQADRHRALLKAINAGRLADGGTAGYLRAEQRRYTAPQVTVAPARVNLDGVRFEGRVEDRRDGTYLVGVMRDVARQEIAAEQRFESTQRGD